MEKNNEQKSVEQLAIDVAKRQAPFKTNRERELWIDGWVSGHTAASEGMVKKDDVVKLGKKLLIKTPTTRGESYNEGIADFLTQIK